MAKVNCNDQWMRVTSHSAAGARATHESQLQRPVDARNVAQRSRRSRHSRQNVDE
jgi:hypothetical protein